MAYSRGKCKGGIGGRGVHSSIDHSSKTAEVKRAARSVRHRSDGRAVFEALRDDSLQKARRSEVTAKPQGCDMTCDGVK